jgi:hypothetical protein
MVNISTFIKLILIMIKTRKLLVFVESALILAQLTRMARRPLQSKKAKNWWKLMKIVN